MVTGASSGLGRHFAMTLAKNGAKVILAARRREKLEKVAGQIEADGGRAGIVVMDVTDADSVQQGIEAADTQFGTPTIVVNNSGIADVGKAMELSEETWDTVINTNLSGAWRVARQAARKMLHTGTSGTIINIASIVGFRVATGLAAYAVSKAALVQLTRTLALEWARYHIRVNAIAPGYIHTPLNREFFESSAGADMIKTIPQRRVGEPEDLDGSLLLLASDASRYMTGSTIVVDGGHLVSSL